MALSDKLEYVRTETGKLSSCGKCCLLLLNSFETPACCGLANWSMIHSCKFLNSASPKINAIKTACKVAKIIVTVIQDNREYSEHLHFRNRAPTLISRPLHIYKPPIMSPACYSCNFGHMWHKFQSLYTLLDWTINLARFFFFPHV